MHDLSHSCRTSADLTALFDWKSDIERLERHAEAARLGGTSDPWTLCEAECSLDLIDNELSTLNALDARRAEVAETIRRHQAWRSRLERVIAELQPLEVRSSELSGGSS